MPFHTHVFFTESDGFRYRLFNHALVDANTAAPYLTFPDRHLFFHYVDLAAGGNVTAKGHRFRGRDCPGACFVDLVRVVPAKNLFHLVRYLIDCRDGDNDAALIHSLGKPLCVARRNFPLFHRDRICGGRS